MNSLTHIRVFSLVLLAAASASAGDISPDAFNQARTHLREGIDSGQVAGGSHLVNHKGRTVYFESAGLRDIETRQPFDTDTILRIYSMTKPITSVAAMMLYEQGKFQLDDPVSRYIPAFADTTVLEQDGDAVRIVPARRPITIRDVFRHTTGYSYGDGKPSPRVYYEREGIRYRAPAAMLPPQMSIARAATALARIPALHHPGERFTYGFSTDLLGRLIEIWSDKPFDQYLQQSVFKPLHMVDTGFSIPEGKRKRFASCHTLKNNALGIIDKASVSEFNSGFPFLSGGGGLLSTVPDYAHFCRMLVDYGMFQGQRLLKEDTVRLMFTDQLNGVAGDFRFGLGFAIADVPVGPADQQRQVKQYSWGGYASTDFRLVPDEHLFQIVARQRVPSAHGLAQRLFPVIYHGLPTQ
ncbi:MAG: serine hydrolase domain-containing protein [Planctomycetaceae bacterium]